MSRNKRFDSQAIHSHLDDANIRDFLSKSFREATKVSGYLSVKHLEQELERIKAQIVAAKAAEGIEALIEKNGWKEFDVSDDVPFDGETYFSFLGTQKEYVALMKKIHGKDWKEEE